MTSDSEPFDTDLHTAVRYGDLKEVRQALRCRLSPNKIGLYKWSPLHEAASHGYNDIVKILLQHGGDPNLADRLSCNTSVHYAAQEGHYTCLSLLLEAGGDYTLTNSNGESALEVATRMCQRVIEKKRVQKLISMQGVEAKQDASDALQRLERLVDNGKAKPTTQTEEHQSDISITEGADRVTAWNPQITDSSLGTIGQLHISFEYHSKKHSLKVRLWKLSGVMMSPTQSSMISTIYVKSSIIPDKNKQSKRRSEEIKVQPVLSALSQSRKGNIQSYVTETGVEVVFQPVTFKFSKPLVYEPISAETIAEKVLLVQVSLRQKYTQRKFTLGDFTLPLNVAVTKIVKESFPLRVVSNTVLPDTMVVLPEIKVKKTTASDPNLRVGISPTPSRNLRPASDMNLREVLSVGSSHSATVSIDMPFEEEIDDSQVTEVKVENCPSSSNTIIRIPTQSAEGVNMENIELPSVVSVDSTDPVADVPPDVRITVTNADSSSSDSEEDNQQKTFSLPHIRAKKTTHSHTQSKVTSLLEQGKYPQKLGADNPAFDASLTSLTNLTERKFKLKPKVSHAMPQVRSKETNMENENQYSASLRGSDVVVSVDLELEDLETPAPIHDTSKKKEIPQTPV